MVQYLSIIFFSWISSTFVGFFKSSLFCVSPCFSSSTHKSNSRCSLEHERNYTLYRDRLYLRFFFLPHVSSYSSNPLSCYSVYYTADNHLSYHILSSPTFPPSHSPVYSFFPVLNISSYFLSFLVFFFTVSFYYC